MPRKADKILKKIISHLRDDRAKEVHAAREDEALEQNLSQKDVRPRLQKEMSKGGFTSEKKVMPKSKSKKTKKKKR